MLGATTSELVCGDPEGASFDRIGWKVAGRPSRGRGGENAVGGGERKKKEKKEKKQQINGEKKAAQETGSAEENGGGER